MRRAVLQALGALDTYRYGVDTYDASKLGLGTLIYQRTGAANEDKFAGPAAIGLARPMEQTTAIASQFPWAMQWQNDTDGELDWVFLADLSAVAATRRINAYTYNRRLSAWAWKGFVTVTFPVGTNITVRGFRMTYDKITDSSNGSPSGSASVSGTAITFNGVTPKTDGACVGNRIGFGSNDPTQISTWYELSALASDGSGTLSTDAGVVAAGPFVIEDLRCVMACTNATAANGGLFVVKGLNFDRFDSVGGTVPAAVTTDNIRACYWLADAASVLNQTALGVAMEEKTAWNSQMVYVPDTVANQVVYKYNIRAALAGSPGLAAGKSLDAFQFKTGNGGVVTGAPTQLNNARIATLNHGPHSGVPALYYTTATRIYAAPLSGITPGSTTWLSSGSVMTENPPGGVATFAATGAMGSLEYSSLLDKLIIATSATQRNYVTQFRTDAGQLDRIFGVNTFQIDQSTEDATATPIPSQTGGAYTLWSEGGMLYIATAGTTAITNRLYAVPLSADWEYAATTNARLVLPEMSCPEIDKFVQFFADAVQVVGGASGKNLGLNTEPFRMYYRTSGITDNSGSWTLLDSTGMASIAGTATVQLMIEFRTIGTLMIPARILNVGVIYDDVSPSDYWQGSAGKSSVAASQFAFRQAQDYGTTVPRLKIRLFNSITGALLDTDDTTTAAGTWERSTDGTTFVAWTNADRTNETTYIRWTPAAISAVPVTPVLTEY